jgi:hypothetical protein
MRLGCIGHRRGKKLLSILEKFIATLKGKFALPGAASPEDQLKAPVAELLIAAGKDFNLSVDSRTETHLADYKVRPDIAVYVASLICGYVELKAPGLGADAPKLKGEHNKKQWEKLKGLPNLIYTDGREWALYRGGELQGAIVRLADDPTARGKGAVEKTAADALSALQLPPVVTNRATRAVSACSLPCATDTVSSHRSRGGSCCSGVRRRSARGGMATVLFP